MMFWLMLACSLLNIFEAFVHIEAKTGQELEYFGLAAFCLLAAFLSKKASDLKNGRK